VREKIQEEDNYLALETLMDYYGELKKSSDLSI
jgi:hypothetical protein